MNSTSLGATLFDLGVAQLRAKASENTAPEAIVGIADWQTAEGRSVARICTWCGLRKPGLTEAARAWADHHGHEVTDTICTTCQRQFFPEAP
jgi:hypothetical protein